MVAAGNRHTVGLRSDGTVVAVGDNYHGQLSTAPRISASPIPSATRPERWDVEVSARIVEALAGGIMPPKGF